MIEESPGRAGSYKTVEGAPSPDPLESSPCRVFETLDESDHYSLNDDG